MTIPDIDQSYPILDVLKVTNNLVESVGKLPNSLTSIFLNENRIKSFKKSNLSNLESFVIFQNKLEKPPNFGPLKVKELFFVSNKLKTFEIEDFSKSHQKNDDDDDDENSMTKQIPLKINPEALTRINISNNKLDKISPSIFDLPHLIYLNVEKK